MIASPGRFLLNRKRARILLYLFLLGLLCCSKSQAEIQNVSSPGGQKNLLSVASSSLNQSDPSPQSSELVFWNFWDPKLIQPVIDRFESLHPGIRIRNEQLNWGNGLDKVVVALANGLEPDICELGSTWTARFMAEGALVDLTDRLADLTASFTMWEPARWKGRTFGLPWLVGTRVLFYNRTLFRQHGLDPERPPTTWDELLTAAGRLHQPSEGISGFGINVGEGHILYKKVLPFVWGNGGEILDPSGKLVFDSPQTRQALEFYRRLLPFGLREKQTLLDDAFKKGKLGLEISGSWNLETLSREAPNLDFGVTLIPRPSQTAGRSCSFQGGEVLSLFRSCRNVPAASEFIRFLACAENTLPITKATMVSFPADRAAFQDPWFSNPRLAVFVKQLSTAVHPPVQPVWIDLEGLLNHALEQLTFGADLDQTLKELATGYQELLKKVAGRHTVSPNPAKQASSQILPFWLHPLLSVLVLGTIITAICSLFLFDQKKNGSWASPAHCIGRSDCFWLPGCPSLPSFGFIPWRFPSF